MPIAPKFLYMSSSAFPGTNYLLMRDKAITGNNPNGVASTTIYTVAKVASQSYWQMTGSTNMSVAANTSLRPVGNPSPTRGDCWIAGPFNGVFLPGTWSAEFGVNFSNASSAGYLRFRVLKGSDISGSNATTVVFPEISVTQITGTLVNTFVTSSRFFTTTSVPFANEYLFVQPAWAITAAGGANGSTVTVMTAVFNFLSSSAYEETSMTIWDDDLNPGYA